MSSKLSDEEKIQLTFKLQTDLSLIDEIIFLLLNDPNPIVRHEAAYVLGEIQEKEKSIQALELAILKDENRFVIHEALLALSNRGRSTSKLVIEGKLTHSDKDVSETAEISMIRLNNKIDGIDPVIDPKRDLLNYENSKETRIQACFKLINGGSEAVDVLIQGLINEPSPIVKHEIVFALGEAASKKATEALKLNLKDETNDFVIHETLLSLATLAEHDSEEIISSFIDHVVSEISQSAKIAIERLN